MSVDTFDPDLDDDAPKPKQVRVWIKVSRHDHVGSMEYGDGDARCRACGQRWTLGPALRGWVPQPYRGREASVRVSVAWPATWPLP